LRHAAGISNRPSKASREKREAAKWKDTSDALEILKPYRAEKRLALKA
jgi:hypothetical protein